MSRIPVASCSHLADQVEAGKTFSDKVASTQQTYPNPMATMTALHYEAAAVINRLAVLVDRSASSVLIDKASDALERWNQDVVEAPDHDQAVAGRVLLPPARAMTTMYLQAIV